MATIVRVREKLRLVKAERSRLKKERNVLRKRLANDAATARDRVEELDSEVQRLTEELTTQQGAAERLDSEVKRLHEQLATERSRFETATKERALRAELAQLRYKDMYYRIFVMDSLTSSISEHVQRSLNGIFKYLKHMKLVPSNAVITAHALKVPIQNDAKSCGIYMLSNIEFAVNHIQSFGDICDIDLYNEDFDQRRYRQKLIKSIYDCS